MSIDNGAGALAKSVHNALKNNVVIRSYLGQNPRLYDHAPEDPTYPYLSYGQIKTEDIGGDNAALFKHTMSLHIWSRYCGRAEALHLSNAVCNALAKQNLIMTNTHLVNSNIVFTDIFRAPDGITLHGVIRLIAISSPQ